MPVRTKSKRRRGRGKINVPSLHAFDIFLSSLLRSMRKPSTDNKPSSCASSAISFSRKTSGTFEISATGRTKLVGFRWTNEAKKRDFLWLWRELHGQETPSVGLPKTKLMANCDGVCSFFEHLTRRLWGSLIAFNWQLAVDNRLLGPVSIAELFLIRLI